MKHKRIWSLLLAAAVMISSAGTAAPFSVMTYAAQEEIDGSFILTEAELDAAGVDWHGSDTVTVYARVTEGGADSKISACAWLGTEGVSKSSTKRLSGSNVKVGNAIQDNVIGLAGTGLYAFPDLTLYRSTQDGSEWQDSFEDEFTLTVIPDTENTACTVLGLKFSNGAVYALEEGFSPDTAVLESRFFDVIEKTPRDFLKMSLDYCEGMDSSKYLPRSWEALQAALADAYAVYETEGSEDSVYTEARARLEKVKCAMLFADTGTPEDPLPFREISGDALVRDMGAGINLGNTMDGHSNFAPNETSWQSVRTTKAYIKALHDAGFNTVRIPVTWGGTIDRDTYEISTKWLDRVEEIVDYCVSLGMYAIINIHHDGAEQTGWLRVASDDIDAVHEKFECVWRNIAERFKDYDEHLIFESMNEITCMREDKKNSQEAVDYDTPIIVDLNQIFVNVVRSTGSNNEKRWLAAVAHYANSGNHKDFVLPDDPAEVPHIMFAAHIYKSNTNTTWTYDEVYQVVNGLKMMADKFDVPMYLGEYGNRTKTQEGTATGYNDAARAYFSEIVHRACQTAGVVPVVWDQGYGEDKYETGLFTYWDREQCVPLFKSITDAMMRGTYLPNSELNDNWDYTDVTESPEVIPITKLDPDYKELEMVIGSTMYVSSKPEPIGNNDVVLWSSDDESVATVSHGSQGAVHAVGIGTTTIRLRTQNSDISSEIKLTVKAAEYENAPSEVLAPKDMIVEQGKSQLIGAALPEGTEGYLTYKSSDPDTVAVSPTGRVFAVGTGAAYVTITADSGASAVVRVYATEDADVAEQHAPTVMSDYSGGKADIDAVGGTAVLELTTEPFAPICFTSRNSAVVSVNSSTAITADENGKVRATVTAMSVGSTTVTARAINGAEISYEVNVLHETPSAPWLLIAGIAAAVIIAIVAVVILVRKKRNK